MVAVVGDGVVNLSYRELGVVSLNGIRLFLSNVSLDCEMPYFNPGSADVSDSPLIQADTIDRRCNH